MFYIFCLLCRGRVIEGVTPIPLYMCMCAAEYEVAYTMEERLGHICPPPPLKDLVVFIPIGSPHQMQGPVKTRDSAIVSLALRFPLLLGQCI